MPRLLRGPYELVAGHVLGADPQSVAGHPPPHRTRRGGHPATPVRAGRAGGQRSHLQPVPVPARVTVVEAPDDLVAFRRRWIELFESGGYAYALPVPPTEIVVDADGVRSSTRTTSMGSSSSSPMSQRTVREGPPYGVQQPDVGLAYRWCSALTDRGHRDEETARGRRQRLRAAAFATWQRKGLDVVLVDGAQCSGAGIEPVTSGYESEIRRAPDPTASHAQCEPK